MSGDQPHVFHLITRLVHGGAEAKTIATIRGLDGYRFSVGFGAEYDQGQRQEVEAMGVDTVRFRLIRHYDPVAAVQAVGSVARHLRRNRYDLVHTHSTEAGIIGRLAARVAGVPNVVHTVHGVPWTADRNPILNRFVVACERCVARSTDRIVTNADVIAEEYLRRGIGRPEQFTTVYSGIDVERFEEAGAATDLPGPQVRVTMVSRLVEGKGLDILLDAVERIEREDFSVCVVGDGPLRDKFELWVAARGLDEDVFAVGYREDVPSILAASDVFVLPSFREGTPRVITEAMASGLPVVATDVAGIPEQVADGENGYLVPPGDASTLADRIARLVSDGERRTAFGEESRRRVKRFQASRMVTDVDRLYRELLDR